MTRKGTVLLNYNFKGGVGKTTITSIESYIMQGKDHKKVLLIDFDTQQNLTEIIKLTYHIKEYKSKLNLYEAMSNNDLAAAVTHINDNLDIIANDALTDRWFRRSKLGDNDRHRVLDDLIKPLKHNYDYIFIDVPPSINDSVINAMFAADGIAIILQTQKMAYTSALKTVQYLAEFRQDYDAKFKLLGIIIYLYNKTKVSREIVHKARRTFPGGIFENSIRFQERINGFMMDGISTKDYWDKRAIGMYYPVTQELMKRAEGMIKNDK